jgi:23S rRNA pseudouridine2605 synthase
LTGAGEPAGERLQKVLARCGFGSRRACDEMIEQGRVSVNGVPATLGRRVDTATDEVAVDGVTVGVAPDLVYYLLNKPQGVVTTADDPEGRPVVLDLVPSDPRVFPVGRLDIATEGLLILTNDGLLAQRLAHPSHGVHKQYLAEVEGSPPQSVITRLRRGVDIGDAKPTAPASVTLLGPGLLRLTVHEGRYRQIRRMCAAVGYPVRRLVRTQIGPLSDNRLAPGAWRKLTPEEVRSLAVAAAANEEPPPA